MAIYQDLVDDHGFPAAYASVRRFVRKLAGEKRPEAHGVILTVLEAWVRGEPRASS
jgi:hypothetical protein